MSKPNPDSNDHDLPRDKEGDEPEPLPAPKPTEGGLYPRWRLEQLLTRAGYDPAMVPANELGKSLVLVASCHEKQLFDVEHIAEAVGISVGKVRKAVNTLRVAAKPGTRTG